MVDGGGGVQYTQYTQYSLWEDMLPAVCLKQQLCDITGFGRGMSSTGCHSFIGIECIIV